MQKLFFQKWTRTIIFAEILLRLTRRFSRQRLENLYKKSENDILILSDTCACRWHGRCHSRCRGKCPLKNKKVNSPLLCGIVVLLTKIQA